MEYRNLGKSGLRISLLGFGAGQLQALERSKAVDLLVYALRAGINYIDIDRHNDETLIRDAALKAGPDVNLLYAGKSFAQSASAMRRDIEVTLKRFDADILDMYCLHMVRSDQELHERKEGALQELLKARDEGLIRAIGVSGHRVPVLLKALKMGCFDYVIVPYNLMHRKAEELFALTREQGIGVITFMTFGGGVLLDPGWGRNPHEDALDPKAPVLFSLSRKEVSAAIVGTNKQSHLQELLRSAEDVHPMSQELVEEKSQAILASLGEDFCRGCRYCIRDGSHFTVDVDKILRLKVFADRLNGLPVARQEYARMDVKPEHFAECIDPDIECPYGLDVRMQLAQAHEILAGEPPEGTGADMSELRAKIIEYKQGNPQYDLVLRTLRAHIVKDGENPELYHHLGECLMEAGDYQNAIKWLKKATSIDKRRNWTHFSLGKCYFKTHNLKTALRCFDEALEHSNDRLCQFHSHYFKAICHQALGAGAARDASLASAREFDDLFGSAEITEEHYLLGEILAQREEMGSTVSVERTLLPELATVPGFGSLPPLVVDTSHFRKEHYSSNEVGRIMSFCIDSGLVVFYCSDQFDPHNVLSGIGTLSDGLRKQLRLLFSTDASRVAKWEERLRQLVPGERLGIILRAADWSGKGLHPRVLGVDARDSRQMSSVLRSGDAPACVVIPYDGLEIIKGSSHEFPVLLDTSICDQERLADIRVQILGADRSVILRLHTIEEAWEMIMLLSGAMTIPDGGKR